MKNLVIYDGITKDGDLVLVKTLETFEDFKSGIRVFCAAPYYEILTEEDCKEEYESYVEHGIAFGCYVEGKLAGINCILNDVHEDYSIRFPDKEKVAYYSGLAVKDDFRGKGLGKILVSSTERYLEDENKYDYAFARILCKGSMSEGIFKRNGFQDAIVEGTLIVDDVCYERNDPNVSSSDKRKYMVKKLNPNALGVSRR